MKSDAIVRIVLFSIAILLLAGLLIVGLGIGSYSLFNGSIHLPLDHITDGNVASSGEVSADTIRDLDIDWVAGSITIQPGDTDTITFHETDGLPERDRMVWKVSGNKLSIRFSKSNVFIGFSVDRSKDLVITVPKEWMCSDLNIDSVSAEIDIQQLNALEADINNVSGKCTLQNCTLNELTLENVSGNIDITGTVNEIECDTVSGNCTASLATAPSHITLDSVSGDLKLTLEEVTGFTVNLDSMSGELTSDFSTASTHGNYIYGDGRCRIDADTVSGNVIIRKATGN